VIESINMIIIEVEGIVMISIRSIEEANLLQRRLLVIKIVNKKKIEKEHQKKKLSNLKLQLNQKISL